MAISAAIDVVAERHKAAASVLEPLFTRRADINMRRLGAGRSFIVGLVPRGINPATVTAPDQVRVPTKEKGIFANYYEVWLPQPGSPNYELERAYLHLHRKLGRDDQDVQLLSLHCDPSIEADIGSYIYKRGPHLHIGGASPNIDRAHVSLCVGDVDLGGADIDALTFKLAAAVEMISDEFFPHYAPLAA